MNGVTTPTTSDSGSTVRSLYFYVASLVTLGLVVGSVIALIVIAMQAWVFPAADPAGYRLGPPPEPYLTSLVSEKTGTLSTVDCSESCALTENDQSNLAVWQQQYAEWQQRMQNPNTSRIESLITALSLLVIALPLFIIHFRIVQREGRQGAPLPHVRSGYFYLVSLAALLMIVIGGSIFLNSVLRLWLVPQPSDSVETVTPRMATTDMGSSVVATIQSCADVCELSPAIVSAASTWESDYTVWEESQQNFNGRQNAAAQSLPFVLLGIPLFWYHWRYTREKKRQDSLGQHSSHS